MRGFCRVSVLQGLSIKFVKIVNDDRQTHDENHKCHNCKPNHYSASNFSKRFIAIRFTQTPKPVMKTTPKIENITGTIDFRHLPTRTQSNLYSPFDFPFDWLMRRAMRENIGDVFIRATNFERCSAGTEARRRILIITINASEPCTAQV